MTYWFVRGLVWGLIRVTVAVLGGLRVQGRENVPRSGPLIIAANHLSFSDPAVIGVTVRRPLYFMATSELFGFRFLGVLARVLRAYPVEQDSPDRAALRKTQQILNHGDAVVIFPEGHVSLDGRLQAIQPGSMFVALHTHAPILPVWLEGTDRLMPPRQFRMHHAGRRIVVRIGKPISPEELAGGLKGRDAIDHGAQVLESALRRLSNGPGPDPAARSEQCTEESVVP